MLNTNAIQLVVYSLLICRVMSKNEPSCCYMAHCASCVSLQTPAGSASAVDECYVSIR